jgi:lysophospholipase L1-like esterase
MATNDIPAVNKFIAQLNGITPPTTAPSSQTTQPGTLTLDAATCLYVNDTAATVGTGIAQNGPYSCTIIYKSTTIYSVPWIGNAPSPGQVMVLSQSPILFVIGSPSITGLGGGGGGGSSSGYPSTFNLPKWHRAKAQVRAGTQDRKVALLGDSIIYGYGSSLPGIGAGIHLANILGNDGIPSAIGCAVPNISGGLGVDSRWGVGSGWTQAVVSGWGFGGANPSYSSTGGAGVLLFIPANDVLYDSFDIYYITDPAYGSFQAGATGGTLSTIPCNGAAGVGKFTCTAGGPSAVNALGITTVVTGATILAVEPWLSTQPKIRIGVLGVEGTTTTSWVLPSSPTGFGPLQCIAAYAPDTTIISLGTNDATAGTSVATFLSNLGSLAAVCSLYGDVFIMSSVPSNPTNTGAANEILYANALPAFCATNGYGYIPLQESWGGASAYAKLNPLGYYNDTVHPSDTGYADYADFIATEILKY